MGSKSKKTVSDSEIDCKKKHNKKSCSSSSSSKSSKSSCSSSSSNTSIEVNVITHKHKKDKKKEKDKKEKDKKEKDKKDKKEIDCYNDPKDKDKDKHKHKHSESDSDCKKKYNCSFDEIYKYFKNKLLMEEDLMIIGSSAYLNAYNNKDNSIPTNYPVEFENVALNYNIEHVHIGAPFCVRESGIYLLFFIISSDQACQFTVFINGEAKQLSISGNNSGAGQLILRNMFKLYKNYTILFRNYQSSSAVVQSNINAGGLQIGNNETFLMMKIAPFDQISCDDFDFNCLSSKKQYLFKKLLDKLLLDPELMMQGFNTHGTFYNTNIQEVLTEADVVFDTKCNVNNLSWIPSKPEQVQIMEDGIYKVFFYCTTNTAAQISIAVNGNPVEYTTQGTNKGAGQLTVRSLLELKKDDIITVKNHTSVNGKLVFSSNAGGVYNSMSVILTVFKIAPIIKPCINYNNKCNDQFDKCYDKFKDYLLSNKTLQITGSSSYFTISSSNHQPVPVNSPFYWNNLTLKNSIGFVQGTSSLKIYEDGIYDLFADVITSESSQITLFINGTPDLSTVSGRDSGGSRCIMRQFVKLSKGDIIEIRNYESHIGTINTSLNSGGNLVSTNCLFMGFLLSK